ncbi:M15 family metallopeptidase [Nonlabens ulvanivorans]|uniref:D-alanyl-D-alanine carboxypeptidase n=1 Tax=Nonlabens ulvanivorans TaxID=906888 RepID=A0A084JSX2_NONUL|nr:M15 family metallopeptidase [Nonlabens ulvanivorans]KEZ92056.1 D-alanyl-D-alanine carboxypeptidase [Nonlabens ulvanivorans]PRX14884.1 D-alanyl-D-alanine carboxypeptidase-like protein [Nonlabens ulvanivorans]
MKLTTIFFLFLFASTTAQISTQQLTGQTTNVENALESDAQSAFNKMRAAALKDGIDLKIVSGYRSFNRQRQIWNRKYKKYTAQGLAPDAIFDKIVEYSTVPGTSRHHWGTDMDIIDQGASYSGDVLVPNKFHGEGPFCKMKDWMEQHAATYGFELVYTLNENRTGFKYEPWHYSYAPLSRKLLKEYLSETDFLIFLRSQDILGMEKISDERLLRYYNEHIKGVNPSLQ